MAAVVGRRENPVENVCCKVLSPIKTFERLYKMLRGSKAASFYDGGLCSHIGNHGLFWSIFCSNKVQRSRTQLFPLGKRCRRSRMGRKHIDGYNGTHEYLLGWPSHIIKSISDGYSTQEWSTNKISAWRNPVYIWVHILFFCIGSYATRIV